MEGLKLCVNSQTPLVQFLHPADRPGLPPAEPATDLSELVEGTDYRFSPGGVTRMVYPVLRRWIAEGFLTDADWVSLNPSGPEQIRAGGVTLHHVTLQKDRMAGYGKVKEALWGAAHGSADPAGALDGVFWTDDYAEYAYYNRLTAERIANLDRVSDFDLYYIHDFQQLPVGHMLATLKPKLFRWHIPFDETMLPDPWTPALASYFNSYDTVVVSSPKYLEALKAWGYTGRARTLYPYIDPGEFSRPPRPEVEAVARSLGIAPRDEVVLVVARMDPMKGQDRVIRAVARLARRHPRLRLVLVGNGSFSGSRQGVGLSKSEAWHARLAELAKKEGVEDRVVFAGHLGQRALDSMYERCRFTVLPSVREGFGLVVVESWLHRKAPIVTRRAGIAHLVVEGRNGRLVDPEDPAELAEKMESLLADAEGTRRMGQRGAATAKRCSLDEGIEAEAALIRELV